MNNWQSVIVQGNFEELTSEEDKYYAMKKLADQRLKLQKTGTAKPPHLSGSRKHLDQPGENTIIVYRIAILEKSGRYESN